MSQRIKGENFEYNVHWGGEIMTCFVFIKCQLPTEQINGDIQWPVD